MFGQGFNYGFLGKPLCFTDTTDIFKDNSGVALYTLDYDASDSGGATGKFNEGAVLTGTSSQINFSSIPLSAFNATTVSVSLWVNMQALTSGYSSGSYIFRGRGNWIIQVTTNGVIFQKFNTSQGNNGNNDLTYNFSGGTSLNQWYHIVVTDNGTATSGLKLYVDGVLRDSNSGYANIDDNSWIAGIANYAGRAGGNFKVDQLRIFNKVISASEVATLYNETKNTTNTLQILGDTSCIATYKFDGSSTDLSGNYNGTDTNVIYKYDGTPTNVDFGVGGKTLYGARYNGSSSKIVIPASTSIAQQNNYTFSAWFKTDTLGVMQTIYAFNSPSTYQSGIFIHSGGTNNIRIFSAGSNYYSSNNIYTNNQWYHIAVTKSSTNGIVAYLDGVEIINEPTATANNSQPSAGDNRIGAYKTAAESLWFDGSIDQVRIFNKALSSAEVSKLYGNGAGEIACAYTSTTDNVAYPITNTAYYKLDNNSKDSSKSRGKFNQGATFIGNSAGIVNTTLQLSSTAHSVSLWMKPQDLTASKWQIMFFSAFNGYPSFTLGKRPDRTTSFHYRNESSNEVYFTLSNANTWYHVVVTRNNSGSTVYVNGSSVATDSNSMGTYSSSSYEKASIGSNPLYPAEYFDGTLDQIRVYDVALTATDVANLYNNETTATTGTLSFPTGKTAIATYKLDGDGVDISGNYSGSEGDNIVYAYDGTETDIEYRFGRFGQAAVFNGTSSKINTGISSISAPFAVSMWINEDVLDSGHFFSNWNSTAADMYWVTTSDGRLRISIDGFSEQYFGTAGDVQINTWHHIAVTLSGGVYEVYLDNVSLGTSTTSVTTFSSGQNFMIGNSSHTTTPVPFNGLIDQVRIFSSALTSAQVTQLYNEKPEADTSNFKAVLYEGTGATQYISNVGMDLETDGGLVWIKNRYSTQSHRLYDSVRGANLQISSNQTASEGNSGGLTSFDSNGFCLDNWASVNTNGNTYVSWVWKGGGDAVTGTGTGVTNVSISANTNAGFSIVKYTGGNSASDTVNHGLTDAEMIILKDLDDGTHNWRVWHKDLSANHWMYLNLNNAQANVAIDGGIRNVDSNSFGFINGTTQGVQAVNNSSNNYIAYVWKSVSGYSKIGSYTGTGATGNVINVGFKPRFILLKNTSSGTNGDGWFMFDTIRPGSDIINVNLQAQQADAESGPYAYTITVSNTGFEPTGSFANYTGTNNNGDTYLYMAFK